MYPGPCKLCTCPYNVHTCTCTCTWGKPQLALVHSFAFPCSTKTVNSIKRARVLCPFNLQYGVQIPGHICSYRSNSRICVWWRSPEYLLVLFCVYTVYGNFLAQGLTIARIRDAFPLYRPNNIIVVWCASVSDVYISQLVHSSWPRPQAPPSFSTLHEKKKRESLGDKFKCLYVINFDCGQMQMKHGCWWSFPVQKSSQTDTWYHLLRPVLVKHSTFRVHTWAGQCQCPRVNNGVYGVRKVT